MKPVLSEARTGVLPRLRREGEGLLEDSRGGEGRAHHLHQLHEGDGVEEVQADEARRPLRRGRHLGDRERRRVRGEDGLRRAGRVEGLVDLALGVEALHHGLDDDVAVGEALRASVVPLKPARGPSAFRSGVTLPFSTPLAGSASILPRPFFKSLRRHLAHDDVRSRPPRRPARCPSPSARSRRRRRS